MPANSLTAFDTLAADYDHSFSQSLTGSNQRMQSRRWLANFLQDKKELSILEINCGTGDDALWLASLGHRIVATDLAGAMISEAKRKQALQNAHYPVNFLQCDFNDLHAQLQNEKFDLIFSNFSGLNCIPPNKLELLNQHFYSFLKPGAHIAVVIFGKNSWWEMAYYGVKLRFGTAFRRWRKKPAILKLKDGFKQPVHYYSIDRFRKLMNQFELIEKRPVGLFIPPSYLENFIKRRPGLFRFLSIMEKKNGGMPGFARFADHCYLLLKKKER
jgi:ubiquinone/menaquinone biosynthesis C-methylase UbiE